MSDESNDDKVPAVVKAFLKTEEEVAFLFEEKILAVAILELAIEEHRIWSRFLMLEETDTNT
ncbi:MAG: hypothetical protein WAV21_00120 [Minisyncoccia bacterium]